MSEITDRLARMLWDRFASSHALDFKEDPHRSEFECIAREMLVEMREPTEAMLKAAFVAMNETPGGEWKRMKAEGVTPRRLFDVKMAPRYRAMIDAAIAR